MINGKERNRHQQVVVKDSSYIIGEAFMCRRFKTFLQKEDKTNLGGGR